MITELVNVKNLQKVLQVFYIKHGLLYKMHIRPRGWHLNKQNVVKMLPTRVMTDK